MRSRDDAYICLHCHFGKQLICNSPMQLRTNCAIGKQQVQMRKRQAGRPAGSPHPRNPAQ
jgi:hypothetical protein